MIKQLKPGTKIRVLSHIRHTHLVAGAEINPTIPHAQTGYETTVRAVLVDDLEDEHGNPITEYVIEAETGELFSIDEIEIIENQG